MSQKLFETSIKVISLSILNEKIFHVMADFLYFIQVHLVRINIASNHSLFQKKFI